MLTCALNRDNELLVQFDIPIPEKCFNHPELKTFTKALSTNEVHGLHYNEKHELTGLTAGLPTLYAIIDQELSTAEADIEKKRIVKFSQNKELLKKKGLQVNFHQHSFDTPERHWNFILNQGNFAAYFFNRINWFLGPKNEYVTDFPLHVDIESASTCNMNCPMCYRSQLKHTGQMNFNLFKKAVDECAENNVFSIRLSWRGETLTHPRIKEMISYATSKIRNVSFLTNAFYLDEEMIDCFINSRVNYIAVSFDGIKEIYETIRHPAKFEENYNRLKLMKEKKNKAGSLLPQVRLCTIWPAISQAPDDYYDTMKNVSDYIVCNPYINFKGPMQIKKDFICQYPWERIVIGYNGDAQCCTGWNADDIILGNIQNKTIQEMWHSRQMGKIRTLHSKGERMDLNSCAQCRHGSQGDPDITINEIIDRSY